MNISDLAYPDYLFESSNTSTTYPSSVPFNFEKMTVYDLTSKEHKYDQITYQDLEKHFHKPVFEAKIHFGMGNMEFRKLCLSLGIQKWPYNATVQKMKKQEKMLKMQKTKVQVTQANRSVLKNPKAIKKSMTDNANQSRKIDDIVIDTFSLQSKTLESETISTFDSLHTVLDIMEPDSSRYANANRKKTNVLSLFEMSFIPPHYMGK